MTDYTLQRGFCFAILVLLLIATILCLVYGIFLFTDPLVVTMPDMLETAHVNGIVLVSVAGVVLGCALICALYACWKIATVMCSHVYEAAVDSEQA